VSASSPSSRGSNGSPYTPEYQTFANGQVLQAGSVIHPPVGGGANPLLAGGLGVTLDPSFGDNLMPRAGVVHHHGGATSSQQQYMMQQQQYMAAQNPSQISPPHSSNSNGSAQAGVCPQSPYITLQQVGGHRTRGLLCDK